jgi:hypothetical protein
VDVSFTTKSIIEPTTRNQCHFVALWYCTETHQFSNLTNIVQFELLVHYQQDAPNQPQPNHLWLQICLCLVELAYNAGKCLTLLCNFKHVCTLHSDVLNMEWWCKHELLLLHNWFLLLVLINAGARWMSEIKQEIGMVCICLDRCKGNKIVSSHFCTMHTE